MLLFFSFTSCIYSKVKQRTDKHTHERKSPYFILFYFLKKRKKREKIKNNNNNSYSHHSLIIGVDRLDRCTYYSKSSNCQAEREREREREYTTFPLPPPLPSHHNVTRMYIQTYINLISYRCVYKYRFDKEGGWGKGVI